MTAALRLYLRRAVDQAARGRVEREARLDLFTGGLCKGCGQGYECWTPGCRCCLNRHYKLMRAGRHPRGEGWYRLQAAANSQQNGVQRHARRDSEGAFTA